MSELRQKLIIEELEWARGEGHKTYHYQWTCPSCHTSGNVTPAHLEHSMTMWHKCGFRMVCGAFTIGTRSCIRPKGHVDFNHQTDTGFVWNEETHPYPTSYPTHWHATTGACAMSPCTLSATDWPRVRPE